MKAYQKTNVFDSHVEEYEVWYEEHPELYQSEVQAIREHFRRLPESIHGIEVGLGTGRFSEPLGIREGVEPSEAMAERARKRGIEVMDASAERLPYSDLHFDFVLYVTVCHLTNLRLAFEEAHRVLRKGGVIIVGFLPQDQLAARTYQERRKRSTFYKKATFYTPERIQDLLEQYGFKHLEWNQTLFGNPEAIDSVQTAKPGHGEGSFVVVSAEKG